MSLSPLPSLCKLSTLTFAVATILGCSKSFAEHIEVITISSSASDMGSTTEQATGNTLVADSADWLRSVPGANVNKNGPVTGIAQYRGMYGDRVSVKIAGHDIIGSGPNAMDAPLSYSVPILMDSMSVHRGIASVTAGMDTIGGAVAVKLKQAQVSGTNDSKISGLLQAGYRTNNEASNIAGLINIAAKEHGFLAYFSDYEGDNYESGLGQQVSPTQFDKQQYGVDYRYRDDSTMLGISYHVVDTNDSGTPALPMDIDYIEAEKLNFSGEADIGEWLISWGIGNLSSDHEMDNFKLRSNMSAAMYRNTFASADTIDFNFEGLKSLDNGSLIVGVDGYLSEHNAVITNPNNAMFNIQNFNDVEDERIGVYSEYTHNLASSIFTLGARLKFNRSNAGEVSHHMYGGNPMVAMLVDSFNMSDRSQSDTNYDITAHYSIQSNEAITLNMSAAIKQRAPSYQERYLWFPLQATGGLADGKTYVGNSSLDSETAYQVNMGFTYRGAKLYLSPSIFAQRIDDYIQGTPSTNQAVVMVATMMMGDETPLQFSNVEAEIYGADLAWQYQLQKRLHLSGHLSYVRGKRNDIDDNLYRIAPPNMNIAITYEWQNWQAKAAMTAYAKQDDIAVLNQEKETSGFTTFDASVHYDLSGFSVELGVNNIFDKQYANHLSGLSRVMQSEVTLGERLPSEGRNGYVKLQYQF